MRFYVLAALAIGLAVGLLAVARGPAPIAATVAAPVVAATAPTPATAGAARDAKICTIQLNEQDQQGLQAAIAAKLERAACARGDAVLLLVPGEAPLPSFAVTYFCDLGHHVLIEPRDRLIVCDYAGYQRVATPLVN